MFKILFFALCVLYVSGCSSDMCAKAHFCYQGTSPVFIQGIND